MNGSAAADESTPPDPESDAGGTEPAENPPGAATDDDGSGQADPSPDASGPRPPEPDPTSPSPPPENPPDLKDRRPAFVTFAHGLRTLLSCDGENFGDDTSFEDPNDHGEYSILPGVVYGAGLWVAATGWGSPGHIVTSADGVNWTDLPSDRFARRDGLSCEENISTGCLPDGMAGIFFDGDKFQLLWSEYFWESADGLSWTETERRLPELDHFRKVIYLDGPELLVIQGQVNEQIEYHFSKNKGLDFYQLDEGAFPADCNQYLQGDGGITYRGETILLGRDSVVCRSTDGGDTWNSGSSPDDTIVTDVFSDETHFYAVSREAIHRSSDAIDWQEVYRTGTGPLGAGAWLAGLGYVAVGAFNSDTLNQFVRSDDGVTWSNVPNIPDGAPPGDVVPGMAAPSERCPAP